MIYKQTPLNSLHEHGHSADVLDFKGGSALEKIASAGTYIPENLDRCIREIQSAPDSKMVYFYDRALGAGETYGANNNGDWFGRDELIKHHDSFVKEAKLYRHHQNKIPQNSVGDVMASAYNDRLDTVDLIVRAPIEKMASEIKRFSNGHTIATSMGAKVKYDVCSYCGNKARTRSAYCNHLKYEMLKMHDDGRQVFAVNPSPKFIDISIVVVPAAPESVMLRKIASAGPLEFSRNHYAEADGRGVANPKVIESLFKLADYRDAVMTLHRAKGLVRPDEFTAILRKDASVLQKDSIPYIGFRRTGSQFIGEPNIKLASLIDGISDLYIEKSAQYKYAFFMSKDEQDEYLRYIGWCAGNNQEFKKYVR